LDQAHIGGQINCTGGQFSNPGGVALNADSLTVDGGMFCGEGFSATGEVRLPGAHIGVQLSCTGGQFSNPDGTALNTDGLQPFKYATVEESSMLEEIEASLQQLSKKGGP